MTEKITVSRDALYSLLKAITGGPHQIRELQATRNLPQMPGVYNPINVLISEYESDHRQRALATEALNDTNALAEELRFYRQHGYPYIDHENAIKTSRMQLNVVLEKMGSERLKSECEPYEAGLYAIQLLAHWPSPLGEGTVMAKIIHAYTVPQLYEKARAHIESLGPQPPHSL